MCSVNRITLKGEYAVEIFKSKIDAWLLIVLLVTIVVCLEAAYTVAKQGGSENYATALFVSLIGFGLPIWLLVSTKYVVSQDELKIFSGPFCWTVPVSSIFSVKDTCSPLSSPALSLDRLDLHYGEGKVIMISPVDKAGFRTAIGHAEG